MKKATLFFLLLGAISSLHAQSEQPNVRTGWTFGVLPSFSYDADLGLQLGLLTNIYYFGDGHTYPEYLHSFYAEAATTSKHYGLYRVSYDSKYLIPGHRLSVDLTYLPDAMCDFYGFNGYQTLYLAENLDEVSRAYYKMKRNMFRFSADLQGEISKPFYWNVGLGLLNYDNGTVDVDRLNRYANESSDPLPDTTTLFDQYVALGLISAAEAKGGAHPYLHGGLTFDTRDRQQNPHRGMHADAFLTYYAGLGTMSDYNNLKFNAAFRHYVPIIDKRLTFAYRLGTQLTLAGNSPFYLNTYVNQLYMQRVMYEGLGGGNTLRGVLRNRVVGNGFAYANVELRMQVVKFQIGKENFYIGLNPFLDGGLVLQPYDMSAVEMVNTVLEDFDLEQSTYAPHLGAGCGLKVAMNDNFVLSVDWATPVDKRDNSKTSNLYIKMGYMF